MVLRRYEKAGAVIVEAVVRSWPPLEPFVIRSTNPGWTLAPDLGPEEVWRQPRRG